MSVTQVQTIGITNDAVTVDKIADNAVGTSQIANDAVTVDKIADNAVETSQIANDAVTAAKISTGAVGTTEIASGVTITGTLNGNASSVTNGVYTTNFPNSFSGSGYQKFPGGFTIQWGTTGGLGQQSQFQAFAIPFSGGVFSVQVTPNGGGGNAGDKRDHWVASSWTLNGFTLSSWFENGTVSYSWIAIGV